jgi:hypothetical protein
MTKISVRERRFAGQSDGAATGLFVTQLRTAFQDAAMVDN